jgi:Na+-driven multidrug efflux pump
VTAEKDVTCKSMVRDMRHALDRLVLVGTFILGYFVAEALSYALNGDWIGAGFDAAIAVVIGTWMCETHRRAKKYRPAKETR